MPGSLSNEDEGQDDMDFEDDMPGEGKCVWGEAGCPSDYFAPLRLECGKRACPAFPSPERRWRRGGCNEQSHAGAFCTTRCL